MHVYFLNVGQGDATLIRTPSGKNILIDGGPQKNILSEIRNALPYLKSKIDIVILTHADRDHIEGLISILERYKVEKVYSTGLYKSDYFSNKFLKLIREKNVQLVVTNSLSDVRLEDGTLIDFLFPLAQTFDSGAKANSNSVVAQVVFGENKILLTGDADCAEENSIIKSGVELKSNILKVGHHGSRTSTCETFLEKVKPKISAISVGADNKYGHPNGELMSRLKKIRTQILRTDKDGRIEITLNKNGVTSIKTQSIR